MANISTKWIPANRSSLRALGHGFSPSIDGFVVCRRCGCVIDEECIEIHDNIHEDKGEKTKCQASK
jgi:hypothetical protein